MDVPMTLTTKQRILIIVGAIIFLIADISMIERIVIIAGIVAYFFMRKQLLVDNSIEYTKSLFKFCLVTFLSPPVSPFPQLNRT